MFSTRTLTPATTLAALVAAVFMLHGQPANAQAAGKPAPQVVELPRVLITVRHAQQAQVVELPRVEIVVRRADTATRLVQGKPAAKPV